MKANKKVPVILHGEAMIFPSSLPESAKAIKPSNDRYHIIADSETTGNHHVVDVYDGIQFYVDELNKTYMVNESTTNVRCLIADRHSAIELPPGCYEFGIQQEFDHFAQHLRNVRD